MASAWWPIDVARAALRTLSAEQASLLAFVRSISLKAE
jgi:hypothetical protein